jgi:hypothetical protein
MVDGQQQHMLTRRSREEAHPQERTLLQVKRLVSLLKQPIVKRRSPPATGLLDTKIQLGAIANALVQLATRCLKGRAQARKAHDQPVKCPPQRVDIQIGADQDCARDSIGAAAGR